MAGPLRCKACDAAMKYEVLESGHLETCCPKCLAKAFEDFDDHRYDGLYYSEQEEVVILAGIASGLAGDGR